MVKGVKPIKVLCLSGDTRENWRIFYKDFMDFLEKSNFDSNSEKLKIELLLTVVGEEARNACQNELDKLDENATFEMVIKVFEFFCHSYKNNVLFHTCNFYARNQGPNESFKQYFSVIKELAQACEFGSLETRMIRDKIVSGINDPELREKVLVIGLKKLKDIEEYFKLNEKNVIPNDLMKNEMEEDDNNQNVINNADPALDVSSVKNICINESPSADVVLLSDDESTLTQNELFSVSHANDASDWQTNSNVKNSEDVTEESFISIISSEDSSVDSQSIPLTNLNQTLEATGYDLRKERKKRKFYDDKDEVESPRTSRFEYGEVGENNFKNCSSNDKQIFCCSKCEKRYKSKYNLLDHELIHKEEHLFTCKYCDKKFTLRSSLKMHLNMHISNSSSFTGYKKKYLKKKAFKNKAMHVVTLQRFFECAICKKRFEKEDELVEHISMHL